MSLLLYVELHTYVSVSIHPPKPKIKLFLQFKIGNFIRDGNMLFDMGKHLKFISRTLLVRNGNVNEAAQLLNRLMGKEGFFDHYRRTRRFEKPFLLRRRMCYENVKSIYDEDMQRRIKFITRKNRHDPFPGCS